MLVESQLAEEFGVSKTPVREALSLLSQAGFVDVIPHQGYRVTPITVQDIHEVYELRAIFEGEAAALAAQRATPEEVEVLRSKLNQMDLELDAKETQVTALDIIWIDDAFHVGIAGLTGNRRLAAAIQRLLREAMRLRFTDPHESPQGMLAEGKTSDAIYDALGQGDAQEARQLMLEHIMHSRDRVLQSLLDPARSRSIRIGGSSA